MSNWPVVRQLERLVVRAPSWLAALLFVVPVLSLLPFKILGIWLLAKGHFLWGGAIFVAAKFVSTAVAARLYVLTQEALLAQAWFARVHGVVLGVRERMSCGWGSSGLVRVVRGLGERFLRRWLRG